MKNSYTVQREKIIFRRAKEDDDFSEIAKLIYDTDPYIYPFWFNNDIEAAINYLKERIKEDKYFFNYNNLYVAYDEDTEKIIGVICAVDKSVDLDYDYKKDQEINHNYYFTIENYIKELIKEVKENNFLYISNVCINRNYRGKKIGTHLLGYYIYQMEKAGFDEIALDCLLHNLRAKNLYHRFGFNEMKEIVGFDGTDHSEVEVVSMKRKKGEYLPEEYKALL